MVLALLELSQCHTWANRGKRAAKLEMRGHYLPLHPPCIGGLESPPGICSRDFAMRHTNHPLAWPSHMYLAGNFDDKMEQGTEVSNEIIRPCSPFHYYWSQTPNPTPKTRHGLVGCMVFHLRLSTQERL